MLYLVSTTINILTRIRKHKDNCQAFESYKEIKQSLSMKCNTFILTSICFQHVSSGSIQNVDFVIERSVWLQGRSEEIESIISLLLGESIPYKGRMYINNQEVTKNLSIELYQHIILLEKESIIIGQTIRKYLLYNLLAESQMLLLLQLFSLETIIVCLDTPINELTLTVEQKQLLSMIRVILLKPEVLIINNGLSDVESKVIEKVIIYMKTYLVDTIVIFIDNSNRQINIDYPRIIVDNK
ncbi:MAG: hypothetical protein ACK5LC_09290 [Coprobacillaceae bacterium]